MWKILKGKLYDTDTAICIGSNRSDCYKNDFSYFEEYLYKKKTGEFFLYGIGGPSSKYAEHLVGGGYMDGEKIIPLSEIDAKAWGEDNLSAEEYFKVFGIPEEW